MSFDLSHHVRFGKVCSAGVVAFLSTNRMFLLEQLIPMCPHCLQLKHSDHCQYQNIWPICALVVCSAAAVVTAADSTGVGFVESGHLAMTVGCGCWSSLHCRVESGFFVGFALMGAYSGRFLHTNGCLHHSGIAVRSLLQP